jgi:hypothetical protein
VAAPPIGRVHRAQIAAHAPERELLPGCAAVAVVSLSFPIGSRLAPSAVPLR